MVFGPDERGDAVTFQDSAWQPVAPAGGDESDAAVELPPLPDLEPLPALRPMAPMPAPPWESTEQPAPTTADEFPLVRVPRQAPPPPSGHPAAAASAARSSAPSSTPSSTIERLPTQPAPVASPRRSGRHAAPEVEVRRPQPGSRRILLLGGSEPLGGMLADRLRDAGHRLALHQVRPAARHQPADPDSSAPVLVTGDRTDAEDVAQAVAEAEIALGGLDAVVITPAASGRQAGIDDDPAGWADSWSHALAADVLAVGCAAHTAARSFIARRTAGRIVLVNTAPEPSSDDLAAPVISAAVAALGAQLTGALRPHGIGVSVVTEPGGSAGDFALAQVADVVQALLDTPVLSGVDTVIG